MIIAEFEFQLWIQDSFRSNQFRLTHDDSKSFVQAEWNWHPIVYLVWRAFLAIYFFVWIVLSGTWEYDWFDSQENRITWFIYLTNWSFFVYVLMLIVQAVLALLAFLSHNKIASKNGELGAIDIPWYYKAQWVLYNIGSAAALNVTVIFYAYFVDRGDYVHPVDFHTHGINGAIVVVDLCLTAHPVRPLHFIHSLLFGVIYYIFAVIYTMAGGRNGVSKPYIYVFFDWKEDPGMATLHAFVFCVFGMIIAWIVMCCGYVMRKLLKNYISLTSTSDSYDVEME